MRCDLHIACWIVHLVTCRADLNEALMRCQPVPHASRPRHVWNTPGSLKVIMNAVLRGFRQCCILVSLLQAAVSRGPRESDEDYEPTTRNRPQKPRKVTGMGKRSKPIGRTGTTTPQPRSTSPGKHRLLCNVAGGIVVRNRIRCVGRCAAGAMSIAT